jgi:hypothetical protein
VTGTRCTPSSEEDRSSVQASRDKWKRTPSRTISSSGSFIVIIVIKKFDGRFRKRGTRSIDANAELCAAI